jgi:hypothetical protein
MKYKTKVLASKYSAVISAWPGVCAITLNEAALPDTLDSYFALILDVFHSGDLPPVEERLKAYGPDAGAFETSGTKDRFLLDDIPLRFEFKSTAYIDAAIDGALAPPFPSARWDSTYTFYRLIYGAVMFSRGDWLERSRGRLTNLSDKFWNTARRIAQAHMEHTLSDAGAAMLQNDRFSWLVSSAHFIRAACYTLFCINRQFEPSHRQYYKRVLALPVLPSAFRAQLDTFLRVGADTTMEHIYSTAQIIARGIVAL